MIGSFFPMEIGLDQAATRTVWRHGKAEEEQGRSIYISPNGDNIRMDAIQILFGMLLYMATGKIKILSLKSMASAYLAISVVVLGAVYNKAAILPFSLWAVCWAILRRQVTAVVFPVIASRLANSGTTRNVGALEHMPCAE